jgi:hypothetical protein
MSTPTIDEDDNKVLEGSSQEGDEDDTPAIWCVSSNMALSDAMPVHPI